MGGVTVQPETLSEEAKAQLLRLEDEMWAANRRGDAEVFRRLVAEDGIAVAAFGVFGKDAIVSQVAENELVPADSTGRCPGPLRREGCGIVTYRAEIDAQQAGRPVHLSVYATTVWRQHGDGWLAVLHQQTPIQGGR